MPLVGRDHELEQLALALEHVRKRHDQVVGVALKGDLRYEGFGTPAIPSAFSAANLAEVLSQLGRGFDEAMGHAEAAVRTAEAADHPLTLYWGLFDLGRAHLRRGDLPHGDPGPRAGPRHLPNVADGCPDTARRRDPRRRLCPRRPC